MKRPERGRVALAWALLLFAGAAMAGEIPDAEIVLHVITPPVFDQAAEAAPLRFALLKDGLVFVGGTSRLMTGRLERKELKELEKNVNRVRKLPGLGSPVTLGPGETHYRLRLKKGEEIAAAGDFSQAPPALKPLVTLLETLTNFDHASLRPYSPLNFWLSAREGILRGGCRGWGFAVPLSEILAAPRLVPAAAARGWPAGATPASVCQAGKRYIVTLRPLLPGERP